MSQLDSPYIHTHYVRHTMLRYLCHLNVLNVRFPKIQWNDCLHCVKETADDEIICSNNYQSINVYTNRTELLFSLLIWNVNKAKDRRFFWIQLIYSKFPEWWITNKWPFINRILENFAFLCFKKKIFFFLLFFFSSELFSCACVVS